MHVNVYLSACMLGREVYKEEKKNTKNNLLLSGRLFLQSGAKKKTKKNEAIFSCCEREMLPNIM